MSIISLKISGKEGEFLPEIVVAALGTIKGMEVPMYF